MPRCFVALGDQEYIADVNENGRGVSVAGTAASLHVTRIGHSQYSVLVNGRSVTVVFAGGPTDLDILVNGKRCHLKVMSEREKLLMAFSKNEAAGSKQLEIHAPMPALVVKVEVAVGDEVKLGQGLVVLEAMKMENEIKCHRGGKIREIHIKQGQAVEKGDLLMILE